MTRIKLSRVFRLLLTFLLVFSWLFSGWPPVWNNPRFPPKIQEVQAVDTKVYLTTTGAGQWTVPDDWNDSANSIEVIGGGGGGRTHTAQGAGGGGGGAYSKITNLDLTPATQVDYTVGTGGGAAGTGGDTWFNGTACSAPTSACAKGGLGASSATGALGGASGSGIGTTKYSGGAGGNGNGTSDAGGGGGGAAGPVGIGATGGNSGTTAGYGGGGGGGNGGGSKGGVGGATGGTGGNNSGGSGGGAGGDVGVGQTGTAGGGGGGGDGSYSGGNGGDGTEWDSTHGSGGGGGGAGDPDDATDIGGSGGLYGGGGGGGGTGGSGKQGIIVITYTPLITVTVGNGASEPSNTTIGPGDGVTDLDNFTLVTNTDADTVTALTVTLGPANAYNNIAQVDITDAGNNAKCTAVSGLSSNTVSFSTCNISVGVGATAYKVRITPKTHPNMPAVPGASYDTTGTVTDITCSNAKSLNDSGSATITVDNASPGEVGNTSGTPGNQQVQLNWTNPGDSDFAGVVVLRRDNTAVGDTPAEGNTYIVGGDAGSSKVACVENSSATTCTDSGLNNGTPYHYKIFTKDSRGNYNAGTVPTSSPFTPQVPISISITTDGAIDFGYLDIGSSANSAGDLQTVSVDSGPADLDIKSTNFAEGVNTWTLNTSNGINLVKWEFSKDGSSWTTFAAPEPTSYAFDTNVAQGQTRNLYLRITMPTETASYNQYNSTVTIMASAP